MPCFADASVLISEVAWMGTSADANAEWIELYNNGESVDVTGWTLSAVDGQPSITLGGSIGANTYALLERSDDTTVTGVTAFAIYTGALGNAGEKLELRNENGTVQDSVDGGSEWSIGGDNTSKETLQRSGEPPLGSWSTGAPNPKGGAVGSGEVSSVETTRSSSSGSGKTILQHTDTEEEEKTHLEPSLTLDIGGEQTVTVGAPTTFFARAYREKGEETVVTDVVWNFGDGTIRKGREVEHTFMYTGDYVVSATGNRTGFLREIKDSEQIVVHVVEPSVEIVHADTAYIELHNTSDNSFDLSGFVILSGGDSFRIPLGTYVLPKTNVRFPSKVTGLRGGLVTSLFYPDGALVSQYGAPVVALPQKTVPRIYEVQKTKEILPEEKKETVSLFDNVQLPSVMPELTKTANAFEGATQSTGENTRLWWWLLGLVTAILTTILAVFLVRKEQQEVIEGFLIEEDVSR